MNIVAALNKSVLGRIVEYSTYAFPLELLRRWTAPAGKAHKGSAEAACQDTGSGGPDG